MSLAIMIRDDIIHDVIQTLGSAHHFRFINRLHLNIQDHIFALEGADVLHREFQHVFVANGVGNYVLVQAVTKKHSSRSLPIRICPGIFFKNRRSGESEHLTLLEKALDLLVGFAELRAMTLIKDEHNSFILQVFHLTQIPFLGDGGVELF